MKLLTYIPEETLASVREHGLLSGDLLAKPENRHLLELARPGKAADEWLAFREQKLKEEPWKKSFAGPSAFFGQPDIDRIKGDSTHPMNQRKSVPLQIDLEALLRDAPDTRLHGVELAPGKSLWAHLSDEEWEAMSDEEKEPILAARHHDLKIEEVKQLIERAKNPQELWKHFEPGHGRYAGDVPHVQIMHPTGKIDPKYLEFSDATTKSAATHELVFGPSGAGKTTKANQLAEETGLPIFRIDDEPEWKPFVEANDYNRDAEGRLIHVIEGTPTNKEWKALMRKLAERALARKEPHIIEGTHLMTLTPDELRGHNLHLVNPLLETVKAQRVARSIARRKEKGRPDLTEAEIQLRERLAEDLYNSAQPAAKVWEAIESEQQEKAAATYVPLGVPKPAPKPPMKSPMTHHRYLADDDEHEKYVSVGIDGLLAATEKLLAVNRGLAEPDDRDSLPNDRIYTVDRLMAERIKLDHGRTLRAMMGRLSRIRNLAPVSPDAFGEYTVGYIRSNPLVPALEEINPMHILEQKRRITKMGPGGVGDPNAITEAMQAVSATQFGFVDPIAGPESIDRDTFVFSDAGWVPAPEVTMSHRLACNIAGRLEFHHPEKCHNYPFEGEMVGVKTKFVDFLVTPTHRIWHRDTDKRNGLGRAWQMKFAEDIFDRAVNLETAHNPAVFVGDAAFTGIEGREFPMVAWCKFLAYWMADGSTKNGGKCFAITHSRRRPAFRGIGKVLDELGLNWVYSDRKEPGVTGKGDFLINDSDVWAYVRQFGKAGTKYLPDYVLQQSIETRQGVWQALMETDRRINKSHTSFVSTSKRFARVVERLLISLGHPVSFREEPDSREHVKSTNWVVSKLRTSSRQTRMSYHNGWYRQPYDDLVFCVTVPGGMIFTRRGDGLGHWTGNSEKAGIDVRLAHGTRIGSDGRIYQLLLDRKSGKKRWVSPSDMRGKTLKLPD
jgi:RNA polymerase Rpb2, domain 3